MRLLDKIAVYRLVNLFLGFVLAILKIFVPEQQEDNIEPKPPKRRRLFPRVKKDE